MYRFGKEHRNEQRAKREWRSGYYCKNRQILPMENLTLVDNEISDHIPNQFIMARHKAGKSTYGEMVRVLKSYTRDIPRELQSFLGAWAKVTRIGDWLTIVESPDILVKIKDTNNTTKIDLLGDEIAGRKVVEWLTKEFDVVDVTIEWVTNRDMDTTSLPLVAPKGITNSSYPFIEEGVNEFVDAFLESTETVLLLIGPPGTGKSNLINHIISRSGTGAMITYDPEIMAKDQIFANFIESDNGIFVMEDADAFLAGRTEGNLSMHRFLNVSSGIVSMKNKKLIFSTNLESTEDIDAALLRPGRCFDIVQFRKLTVAESNKFAKEHGWGKEEYFDQPIEKEMTLAELYNMTGRKRKSVRRSIGFV